MNNALQPFQKAIRDSGIDIGRALFIGRAAQRRQLDARVLLTPAVEHENLVAAREAAELARAKRLFCRLCGVLTIMLLIDALILL